MLNDIFNNKDALNPTFLNTDKNMFPSEVEYIEQKINIEC